MATNDVDLLRRAAATIRGLAGAATEGRWFAVDGALYTGTAAPHQTLSIRLTYEDDANHIAAWDPAVALAVALLLEWVVDQIGRGNEVSAVTSYAREVSRTFLREDHL